MSVARAQYSLGKKVECGDARANSMSQKLASFFRQSWFPVLTLIGLLLNSVYENVYADKDRDRAIIALRTSVDAINQNGGSAFQELKNIVTVHTNDISELEKSFFRTESRIERLERNLDRVVWVVDALAEKNGIKPPKQVNQSRDE